jgi:hypothetical protein
MRKLSAFIKKMYGWNGPYYWVWSATYGILATVLLLIFWLHNNLIFQIVIFVIIEFILNFILLLYIIYKTQSLWRPKVLKLWAKALAKEIPGTTKENSPKFANNLSADFENKVWLLPFTKTWQEIYDTWPEKFGPILSSNINSKIKINDIIQEYFYNLQRWAICNLTYDFYLWSDEKDVNVILTEPGDKLLWKLTWDGTMPTPTELNRAVEFLPKLKD